MDGRAQETIEIQANISSRADDDDKTDIVVDMPARLVLIVRAAATVALELAQLDATMGLYEAFYRWARDAVGETHNWPTPAGGGRT